MSILFIIIASLGQSLLLSSFVLFVILIFLVAILLFAKHKLTSNGDVTLKVNDKEIVVPTGSSLLTTLSNAGLFLPSACGGGGTCGLCKCQVIEGGGSILPTETGFFNRSQQKNNWRLGCQVKVRQNMTIRVPESVLSIRKVEGRVLSNKNVASFIKELVIQMPPDASIDFKPGEYIQIDVPVCTVDFKDIWVENAFKDEWDKYQMWSLKMVNPEPTYRAYSMANYPAEKNLVKLNIRIATPPWDAAKKSFMNVNPGICSSYIFSLKPGDPVSFSGPYGEFFIKDTQREMIYVGGGAGMAPLRSHIFHLLKTLKSERKISFWYGARSKREVFYEDEFRMLEKQNPNFTFHLALSEPKPDDNWNGLTGFIHQVLYDNYLKNLDEPEEIEYYYCGPPQMNDALQKLFYSLGIPDDMIAFDDFG